MEICTDASYGIKVISDLPLIQKGCPVFKIPNLVDIVLQMAQLWDSNLHCWKRGESTS